MRVGMRILSRGRCWLMLAVGLLTIVPCDAGPAFAEELRISHQFHETGDARGRASRVFAEELALRAPELKTHIYPQLALGLSRDEQLDQLQAGKLDFAVLPLVFGVRKV